MRKRLALAAACLLAGTASAKIVTKPVDYEQGGVKLQGLLAYDDAKTARGKLPGVLVLPEWWGLTAYPKGRAEQLASLGYVAFAADMYGAGVTTEDAKKAGELAAPFHGSPLMADRARAGLEQLLASGLVDPSRIAAIGFCFGGSAAQALAYTGAPLVGVASFHGGPVNAPPEAKGKVKATFLLMNGAADPLVKPEARAALEKSLDDAGIDYVSIDYGGALHAFSNPGATELAKKNGLAGAIGYDARAERRAWKAMELLFDAVFGRR
ncbi:MAG TPA: dienelactone hydrolase family protein [Thermoanaerobaculia bacterium]|nr:dienelactone hydrolase family protein [Thermoanaerobaculia bacterium]